MGRRARGAGGWTVRIPAGAGRSVYVVRFRHAGRRYELSTGQTDPGLAAAEAARIYADTVSGRSVARPVSSDLTDTVERYLGALAKQASPKWVEVTAIYFRAHLIPFFRTFERFTPASYGDYGRARLQKVSRPSVRHELSALRRFVEWCIEQGTPLPPVPSLPKHGHPGTRAKNARKRQATVVTPAEAKRILAAMPERSPRKREWVRPLFIVLWETGLRPVSVLRLEAPLNYTRGATRLFISREIDKEAFERYVPLTPAARRALDRVCPPDGGRLFPVPQGNLRHWLDAAMKAAGLALDVSPYDFRHSRITDWANAPGPLTGASYLAGHKHASTTALYIRGSEAAARATLAAAGGRSGGRKHRGTRAKGGT